MNEQERRQVELGKADILVGKVIYHRYLFLTVASTTAIAVSIPSAVLNILPQWADITMAALGALNLPGSIQALPKMSKWIKNADETIKDFETNYINASVDS